MIHLHILMNPAMSRLFVRKKTTTCTHVFNERNLHFASPAMWLCILEGQCNPQKMFYVKSFSIVNVQTSTVVLHFWLISLESVHDFPPIPVFLQGILTCWHMRLKYIPNNPIFLAYTTACLILYGTAKHVLYQWRVKLPSGGFIQPTDI